MHTSEDSVKTGNVEIVYDTFGDRKCPAMLLIMGLSAQMIIWDEEFCSRLADRGFCVIRFDNRDVGRSTKLDILGLPDFQKIFKDKGISPPYSLRDMAKDTIGLLDALGVSCAHVVGVSMGGMIAQILGMEYPDRVRTLTIIMSSTSSPLLPPPTPEALQFLLKPFPLERKKYIEHFIEMWQILNGNDLPLDKGLLRKLAERTYERGISPAGSARQLAAVLSSGSRKEKLASIKTPTLVIHGQIDPLLPLKCGKDVALSIPGSRLKIIPGMGHALPPAVWDEIIDAIAGHAQSVGGECKQ
jgi:pimeloyl-ACP methyl ester carboxylesterase